MLNSACSLGWPIGDRLFPASEYRRTLLYIIGNLPHLEAIKQPSHHTFQQVDMTGPWIPICAVAFHPSYDSTLASPQMLVSPLTNC